MGVAMQHSSAIIISCIAPAHGFRSPPYKVLPSQTRRQPRYIVVCQASSTQKGEIRGSDSDLEQGSDFPAYESGSKDAGELLPVRQPGAFPSISVRKSGISGLLQKINADHFEGADEKFAVKSGGIKEFDPLRDGPLRYLGYSNECGEAFAAWLPFWGVPFSYGVAISYVLVDTVDKGLKAYKEARTELDANASLHPEVDTPRLEKLLAVERSMDTVVWQLLASVICPGYTIHSVVAIAHAGLLPIEQLEPVKEAVNALATSASLQGDVLMAILDKSLPTASGLAAIPFIVHPIDNAIHALMNVTLRPAMRKYVCGPGQGALADLDMCIDCQVAAESSSSSTNGSKH